MSQSSAEILRNIGYVSLHDNDNVQAAIAFNKSLFANLNPSHGKDVQNELQLVTTIFDEFNVYSRESMNFVVWKGSDFVGVVAVGDRVYQIFRTPGYNLWKNLKSKITWLGKTTFVISMMSKSEKNQFHQNVHLINRFAKDPYQPYTGGFRQTVTRIIPKPFRPGARKMVSVLAVPARKTVVAAMKTTKSGVRAVVLPVSGLFLNYWIQAKVVPKEQFADDPEKIFEIVAQLRKLHDSR